MAALGQGVEQVGDLFERDHPFEQGMYERGVKDCCLTFLVPIDEDDMWYWEDKPILLPGGTPEGYTALGCVWTRFDVGSQFVHVRAQAATSLMSSLFTNSPAVTDAFVDVAREGGALLLALDVEEKELTSIWPSRGPFTPPSHLGDRLTYGIIHFGVDAYCDDIIRTAREVVDG